MARSYLLLRNSLRSRTGPTFLLLYRTYAAKKTTHPTRATALTAFTPSDGILSTTNSPSTMAMNRITEPGTSKSPFSTPLSRGTACIARKTARAPTGTLMKNIQCQETRSVRIAPRDGPRATPMDVPMTTIAMLSPSFSLGRYFTPSITADDASMAAPMPWNARLASSTVNDGDSPQNSEPMVNITIPATRTLLMAPRSHILPNTSISPAIIR